MELTHINEIDHFQGKVYDLKVSEKKGTDKKSQESVLIVENKGIEGDLHREDINKQISFFTLEGIQKLKETETAGLCTKKFWGNITTEGIEFSKLPLGAKLKIGEALIEITVRGKSCYKNCELSQNGLNCIIPMETAFGRILKGGRVKIGDSIEVIID
jgi:cyclic pyranopterin monophosphate synthase